MPSWTATGRCGRCRRADEERAPHEVPLSRQALAIVDEFPELPGRPYLFGRGGRTPFSGWSRCKERLDDDRRQRAEQRLGRPLEAARTKAEDRSAWTLHDRQALARDHMAEQAIASSRTSSRPWSAT